MRMWIDCEWLRSQIISMALVAEDGSEWYEVTDVWRGDPIEDKWVAENVFPVINKEPIPLALMRNSLEQFLSKFKTVHIIADWPEDIEHFCKLLIRGPGQKIQHPRLVMEVADIISTSEVPHNALSDARGIKKRIWSL